MYAHGLVDRGLEGDSKSLIKTNILSGTLMDQKKEKKRDNAQRKFTVFRVGINNMEDGASTSVGSSNDRYTHHVQYE